MALAVNKMHYIFDDNFLCSGGTFGRGVTAVGLCVVWLV